MIDESRAVKKEKKSIALFLSRSLSPRHFLLYSPARPDTGLFDTTGFPENTNSSSLSPALLLSTSPFSSRSRHSAFSLASIEPVAVEPVAVEPVAVEPVAVEPVAEGAVVFPPGTGGTGSGFGLIGEKAFFEVERVVVVGLVCFCGGIVVTELRARFGK